MHAFQALYETYILKKTLYETYIFKKTRMTTSKARKKISTLLYISFSETMLCTALLID